MKILFIENRYKTYLYEPIAKNLLEDGHDIHWMIQNKEFFPREDLFQTHLIPYPKGTVDFTRDEDVESLIKIDRQFNHFGKKDSSYFYYYNQKISALLDELSPDIIFGESTTFHELLAILNSKRKDILYLNPSTCRYPIGRFSFYKYDTLIPYEGSGEKLTDEDSMKLIDQIIHRTTIPDYMKLIPPSKMERIQDKVIKIKSYALGEKYNTPDPLSKYKLEKHQKKLVSSWDQVSEVQISEIDDFTILYPLQMQPEANIDVWGKTYRDQKVLIETIADNLPEGVKLIVKPNPKSKYEISDELVQLVQEKDNIVALHHQIKMDDVLPFIDLVITVTGTIAIECIISGKPVATLVRTINNEIKSCIYITDISKDLPLLVEDIKNGNFPHATELEIKLYINMLNKLSYQGKISDPFTDISCVSEKNIESLTNAFFDIINKSEYA